MVIPLVLISWMTGDLGRSLTDFEDWRDLGFLIAFLTSCLMGFVLMYATVLCTAYNSALTTTIVGCLKVCSINYCVWPLIVLIVCSEHSGHLHRNVHRRRLRIFGDQLCRTQYINVGKSCLFVFGFPPKGKALALRLKLNPDSRPVIYRPSHKKLNVTGGGAEPLLYSMR